ncbi:hypothetical protein [Calycomorphotria hydatis]|uniref:Tetratricopeptide repeat protein n=1 Tax=Calycomorphotria hydatis TaxID=2528027 RepID=A0A517TAG6_9PLAN|nr:hypothetical protein [Calycomorphotria hydatis]QDT65368.1 hypothetical protein V22_26210 [Calycomorphotria hydatis]
MTPYKAFSVPNLGVGVLALMLCLIALNGVSFAQEEETEETFETIAPPSYAEVRLKMLGWLNTLDPAPAKEKLAKAQALWPVAATATVEESARERLKLAMETFAVVNPEVRQLVSDCSWITPAATVLEPEDLPGYDDSPFFATNVATFYGQYLTETRRFDEALYVWEEVELAEAIDPATVLFYRAICEHEILEVKAANRSLTQLLNHTEAVPASYGAVAALMQSELSILEPDSLGEIAGLMKDVERRLDLGRGGQRVQKRHDEIVTKLDKIIEKIEAQSGGGGGGGQGGQQGNSNKSSSPANESRVKGSTAPGEVDEKSSNSRKDWGDLPAREREKAKVDLGKKFPGNYARLIEEFTAKRARE